jgi:hypothetical protein
MAVVLEALNVAVVEMNWGEEIRGFGRSFPFFFNPLSFGIEGAFLSDLVASIIWAFFSSISRWLITVWPDGDNGVGAALGLVEMEGWIWWWGLEPFWRLPSDGAFEGRRSLMRGFAWKGEEGRGGVSSVNLGVGVKSGLGEENGGVYLDVDWACMKERKTRSN